MRRLPVVALALTLAAVACDDEATTTTEPQFAASEAATGPAGEALYRVTVYNLTSGQPLTPPVAAVHRQSIGLFEVGEPASFEVKEIAENGNIMPLVDLASTNRQVIDAAVTPGPTIPPVLPGEMVQFDVEGRTGAKYLSIVAMLICTNDGFTGANTLRLPKRIGAMETVDAYGYDAGTEENTESWADLVPPCAGLTGFDNGGMGSGMSNPELYEGGVVRMHPGISGDADLDAEVHGWTARSPASWWSGSAEHRPHRLNDRVPRRRAAPGHFVFPDFVRGGWPSARHARGERQFTHSAMKTFVSDVSPLFRFDPKTR